MDVRVLVVDDQSPYLEVACEVVQAADGFALVGTATSGEQAVEEVLRLRPDLVVMDVRLPGMDGVTAAHVIRSHAAAPVVLLVSTYDAADLGLGRGPALPYVAKSALRASTLTAVWASSRG